MLKKFWFVLVIIGAVGCTLRTSPAPPTVFPTATFETILPPAEEFSPPPADAVSPNPDCPNTPSGWIQYTVETGDSLSLLAEQTSSTMDEIMAGNCLTDPNQIFVDQVIFLPRVPVL